MEVENIANMKMNAFSTKLGFGGFKEAFIHDAEGALFPTQALQLDCSCLKQRREK